MEQEVNKSGELSSLELFYDIVNGQSNDIFNKLSGMTIEMQIDFLQYLEDNKICKDEDGIGQKIQKIIFRNLLEDGILKTCIMHKYPQYNNYTVMLHFNISTIYFLEKDTKNEKFHTFDEISVRELRGVYNQLKLGGGVTKEVANTLTFVSGSVISIQNIGEHLNSSKVGVNPIVLDELDGLSNELSLLQFKIDQIKAISYSDLGSLGKKMGWKLFQIENTTDVTIIDNEGRIVHIGRYNIIHYQFTCIVSTDEDTIATSVGFRAELGYIDNSKGEEEITWESDGRYINPAMSELASKILKQGFSGKLKHIGNGYFQLGYNPMRFFNNKGDLFIDSKGNSEFNFSGNVKCKIINGKVVDSKVIDEIYINKGPFR